MCKVLKATGKLSYQRAYLSSELREIFEKSPRHKEVPVGDSEKDPNRKPVEGECPVCFMDFEPGKEDIVYCRSGCGNNIHQQCFQQWEKSHTGKVVRCVYWLVCPDASLTSIDESQPSALGEQQRVNYRYQTIRASATSTRH